MNNQSAQASSADTVAYELCNLSGVAKARHADCWVCQQPIGDDGYSMIGYSRTSTVYGDDVLEMASWTVGHKRCLSWLTLKGGQPIRHACREQIPAQANLTVSMADLPDGFWPETVEAVLANSIATMGAPGRIHLWHKDLPEGPGPLGFSLNALVGGLHHYANIDEQQAWIDNLINLVSTVRANMGRAGERNA